MGNPHFLGNQFLGKILKMFWWFRKKQINVFILELKNHPVGGAGVRNHPRYLVYESIDI
jgi:hypothetical protein